MNSRCHVDAVDRVMAALSQGNHSLTKYWRINKEINFLGKQKSIDSLSSNRRFHNDKFTESLGTIDAVLKQNANHRRSSNSSRASEPVHVCALVRGPDDGQKGRTGSTV